MREDGKSESLEVGKCGYTREVNAA